jgi:hypothetical protein
VFHILQIIQTSHVKHMSPVLAVNWVVLVPMVSLVLDVVMMRHLFYIIMQAIKELLLRNTIVVVVAAYKFLPIREGMQQDTVCRHLNSQ